MNVSNYWWGSYTDDLKEKGYVDNGQEPPYKVILNPHSKEGNGKWVVIKFFTNDAWYSFCTRCGFLHPVSYHSLQVTNGSRYDKNREYNYCPQCGKRMIKTKKTRRKGY